MEAPRYRDPMPRGLDTKSPPAGGEPQGGLRQTLSRWLLKPPDPSAPARPVPANRSVEDLEDEARYADDKERMVGLLAAPVAAGIGFAVARYAHGTLTSKSEMLVVAVVLALGMLAFAWFRKRLFLGITMALYGLSVFSLGYWGFGVPFVLFAAWLLVRAYRVQRDLHEATGTLPSGGKGRSGGTASARFAPDASKRYTPPGAPRKRKAG